MDVLEFKRLVTELERYKLLLNCDETILENAIEIVINNLIEDIKANE